MARREREPSTCTGGGGGAVKSPLAYYTSLTRSVGEGAGAVEGSAESTREGRGAQEGPAQEGVTKGVKEGVKEGAEEDPATETGAEEAAAGKDVGGDGEAKEEVVPSGPLDSNEGVVPSGQLDVIEGVVPSGKICTKERGLLLFQLYTSLTTNMRLRDIEALVEAGAVARLSTPTQPSTNPVPGPYGYTVQPAPPYGATGAPLHHRLPLM